jgi:hypothetical protein
MLQVRRRRRRRCSLPAVIFSSLMQRVLLRKIPKHTHALSLSLKHTQTLTHIRYQHAKTYIFKHVHATALQARLCVH